VFGWREFALVVLALVVITSVWLVLSGHFIGCGFDGGKSDWSVNCRMIEAWHKGNLNNGLYANWVYSFYPSKKMIVVYAGFLLPLLLFFYAWQSKANVFLVLFLYFVSLSPLAYVIKAYMKQILFDMLLIAFMILYYLVKEKGLFYRFSVLAGLVAGGWKWSHGYAKLLHPFGFKVGDLWHNIPFTAVAGVYFSFIGFVQMVMEREFLLFFFIGLPLAFVGMGDSRAYSSLFFMQLPFIARFIEERWNVFKRGVVVS